MNGNCVVCKNQLGQVFENPLWRELGAVTIAQLVRATSGESPQVNRYPDYTEIILTDAQNLAAQEYLRSLIEAEPGPIRMDVGSIVMPVMAKKYGPLIGGIALGLLALGFLVGRGGRR